MSEGADPTSEDKSLQMLLHPAAGRKGTGGSREHLLLARPAGLSGHKGPGNLAQPQEKYTGVGGSQTKV